MSDAEKAEIRLLIDDWCDRTNGTLGDLAARIGVDSSYISHVRAGRRLFGAMLYDKFYEVINSPTTLLQPAPRRRHSGFDLEQKTKPENTEDIGLVVRVLAQQFPAEIPMHFLEKVLLAKRDLDRWGVTLTPEILLQIISSLEKQ